MKIIFYKKLLMNKYAVRHLIVERANNEIIELWNKGIR